MTTFPREIWPSIIRLAAPTLGELARLSTLSRATRDLCWSTHDRYLFLKVILADSNLAIDRLAADPAVLRNPRLFPNLPELLSLFFTDGGPRPGWCGYDGHDDSECLLIKICDNEDEQWVQACLERWPFEPKGGTRNAAVRRSGAAMAQLVGPPLFQQTHLFTASLCLLSWGRLCLLEKVIGDRGTPRWTALMDTNGMDSIVRVARDPLPILTDLFDASLHPERWCWQAIAVAVRRGLPDVVRFLGSHASPYQSELDGVFPMALAQQGPRPPHPPAGHDDNLYVNVETVTALAEIGVRIPPDQFLDFMDNVCKEKGYPERIEDEPVMAALLEIKEEGVAPPANWYATWKFIDRPHLLQQLMDHGILSPDGVDQCLRSCANAGRELGSDGMVDLAHRALSLGASRAKALLSAALEGNSSLMKLMLATKGHGENVKDPEVVMSMLQSQRFTAEMCDIILGPDRAAVLADPSLAVFNMVINKATQTANYVLFQMVNEGSVLGEVKALLDFGFRAKAAEVALAKSLGLQETAALMEGFGTAV